MRVYVCNNISFMVLVLIMLMEMEMGMWMMMMSAFDWLPFSLHVWVMWVWVCASECSLIDLTPKGHFVEFVVLHPCKQQFSPLLFWCRCCLFVLISELLYEFCSFNSSIRSVIHSLNGSIVRRLRFHKMFHQQFSYWNFHVLEWASSCIQGKYNRKIVTTNPMLSSCENCFLHFNSLIEIVTCDLYTW